MDNDLNHNRQIKKFIRKKQILSLSFSLLMAVPFFIFIFIMAFKPDWLSFSYYGSINTGLGSSLGLILLMFVLIWIFVKWKITHDGTNPHQNGGGGEND